MQGMHPALVRLLTGGVFNADAIGGLPLNETTIANVLRSVGCTSLRTHPPASTRCHSHAVRKCTLHAN